jgi:hypothetical protein
LLPQNIVSEGTATDNLPSYRYLPLCFHILKFFKLNLKHLQIPFLVFWKNHRKGGYWELCNVNNYDFMQCLKEDSTFVHENSCNVFLSLSIAKTNEEKSAIWKKVLQSSEITLIYFLNCFAKRKSNCKSNANQPWFLRLWFFFSLRRVTKHILKNILLIVKFLNETHFLYFVPLSVI